MSAHKLSKLRFLVFFQKSEFEATLDFHIQHLEPIVAYDSDPGVDETGIGGRRFHKNSQQTFGNQPKKNKPNRQLQRPNGKYNKNIREKIVGRGSYFRFIH